jgi:hypothetical protein
MDFHFNNNYKIDHGYEFPQSEIGHIEQFKEDILDGLFKD